MANEGNEANEDVLHIYNQKKTGRMQTPCTDPAFLREEYYSITARPAPYHNYSLFILHYSFFINYFRLTTANTFCGSSKTAIMPSTIATASCRATNPRVIASEAFFMTSS